MADHVQSFTTRNSQRLERVFDVDDAKWAHPSARGAWANKMEDAGKMYDLSYGIEEKIAWNDETQKMYESFLPVFDENAPCTHEVVMAPGCPEEPEVEVPLHVVLPKARKDGEKIPVLMLIAGGGMVTVSPLIGHLKPIMHYPEAVGCAVVSPHYRTALYAPYPAAINDLHAAFQWILDNADAYGFDTDRIVLSGVSSGGALACSLPFRLMRYGIFNVRGVLAEEPQTDDREFLPSAQIVNTPWDGVDDHGGLRMWLGNNHGSGRIGPEAMANHATVNDCIGYPPLIIHTVEFDPDSDFNRQFYGKVKEARSYAEYHSWGGIGHAGFYIAPQLAEVYDVVVQNNMRTLFENDLRRPWVVEEYRDSVSSRFAGLA